MDITIVSYNLHAGFDINMRHAPGAAARVLQSLPFHAVVLQEVDWRTRRGNGRDMARDFQDIAGADTSFFSAFDYDGGRYGLAIARRLPLLREERADLSVPGAMEPRIACASLLLAGENPLWVVNTHLGLDDGERRVQAQTLAGFIAGLPGPLVLMGDFNTQDDDVLAPLTRQGLSEAPNLQPTFPAAHPEQRIDRAFVRSGVRVVCCLALDHQPFLSISDHRPLWLTVELG